MFNNETSQISSSLLGLRAAANTIQYNQTLIVIQICLHLAGLNHN